MTTPEGKTPTQLQGRTARLAGLLASASLRSWMSTLEYRAWFHDPRLYTHSPQFRGPIVGICWHDSVAVPVYLWGRSRTVLLTSLHRDADWVDAMAGYLGYEIVRGSTYRGGRKALLWMLRQLHGKNIGIACDGPRGPRHEVSPGAVYLSSKLGVPLVTYAIGYSACWRLKSWDRFAIPVPYSRVHIIFGRGIQVPPHASREVLEEYRLKVQDELRSATAEAQDWAETGRRRDGQVLLKRRPMHAGIRRVFASAAAERRAA
ncbi:MAG: lysophospholipid acyltransferase family protein [Pirellulales bacterium]